MGVERIYNLEYRSRRRCGGHGLDAVCALRQQDVAVGVEPVYSSYAYLVKMLTQGWQIEPPVYVRPRWRSGLRLNKENTYHFVLWNEDRVSLVSVLDCPEVERFLRDNCLTVDRL